MARLPCRTRGRRHPREERLKLLALLDEARDAGARLRPACHVLGLDPRTVQRWRTIGVGDDGRHGPKSRPSNQLTELERARVLATANSPEFRNLSPKQIVPMLADRGVYIASESTFYRVLRAANQMKRRGRSKAPQRRYRPTPRVATGPNQVWSWDITYLRSTVSGRFYFLYMFVDVWSRKVVAQAVHDRECTDVAAGMLEEALQAEGLASVKLVLHSDNGAPMKGATLRSTMERLGVTPSYSRPSVSNDNPFSESLFGTAKSRPEYPRRPFKTQTEAQQWADEFTRWYNGTHLHSAIGFVTPAQRHEGTSSAILARRRKVYAIAQTRCPNRWSGPTRAWDEPATAHLNPLPDDRLDAERALTG